VKSIHLCTISDVQGVREDILKAFFEIMGNTTVHSVPPDVLARWEFTQERPHQLVTDQGRGTNSEVFVAFEHDTDAVEFMLLFG
jgi:hypothetical protein